MQEKSKPSVIVLVPSSSSSITAQALRSLSDRPCVLLVERQTESLPSMESPEFRKAVEKLLIESDPAKSQGSNHEVFECQQPCCGRKICAFGEEKCGLCGHWLHDEECV